MLLPSPRPSASHFSLYFITATLFWGSFTIPATSATSLKTPEFWFIGDTFSTGLNGKTGPKAPPTAGDPAPIQRINTLYPNIRFNPALLAEEFFSEILFENFNFDDLSWPVLLGKDLGFNQQDIYIANHPSLKSATLGVQIEAFLQARPEPLPPGSYIVLSFGIGDLCALNPSQITDASTFQSYISKGIARLRAQSPQAQLVLVSPLAITQLWTHQELLDKPLPSSDSKPRSCATLREDPFKIQFPTPDRIDFSQQAQDVSTLLVNTPASQCPTLFALKDIAERSVGLFEGFSRKGTEAAIARSLEEQTSFIAIQLRKYRQGLENIVYQSSSDEKPSPKPPLLLRSLEGLSLQAKELALDCFHASVEGHETIRQALAKEIHEILGTQSHKEAKL